MAARLAPFGHPLRRRWSRSRRGTTTVEYLIVLSLVFVAAAAAAIALGPDAVALYRTTRDWAALPVPRRSTKKKRPLALFAQRGDRTVEPLQRPRNSPRSLR